MFVYTYFLISVLSKMSKLKTWMESINFTECPLTNWFRDYPRLPKNRFWGQPRLGSEDAVCWRPRCKASTRIIIITTVITYPSLQITKNYDQG
jgi:hypothetical protein